MKPDDFFSLQQSTHGVFASLYLIDVDLLTALQRQQHQAALSAAYLAYVRAENTAFASLNEPMKQQLAELLPRLQKLSAGVSKLTTPPEQLSAAAGSLDVLNDVAGLLGRI